MASPKVSPIACSKSGRQSSPVRGMRIPIRKVLPPSRINEPVGWHAYHPTHELSPDEALALEQLHRKVLQINPPDLIVMPIAGRFGPLVVDAFGRQQLVERAAAVDGLIVRAAGEKDDLEILV